MLKRFFRCVLKSGMQSGALTESGLEYSEALADYLQLEQQADMQTTGKEILVLTGTFSNSYCFVYICLVSQLCRALCSWNYLFYFNIVYYIKCITYVLGTTILHSESTEALKNRGFRVFPTPVLNELRGGDFHGLTKAQFEVKFFC